jgi:hypothetical protein
MLPAQDGGAVIASGPIWPFVVAAGLWSQAFFRARAGSTSFYSYCIKQSFLISTRILYCTAHLTIYFDWKITGRDYFRGQRSVGRVKKCQIPNSWQLMLCGSSNIV